MSQNYRYPQTDNINVEIQSEGLTGQDVPLYALQVAGVDSLGDLRALSVSTSGVLNVSAASWPLPAGAATSANQLLEIGELQDIEADVEAMSAKLPATLGQKAMTASLAVAIASDQSTLAVSAASLPLPSGAATSANQVTQIAFETSISNILASVNKAPAAGAGTSGLMILGTDGTNARFFKTDTSGELQIDVLSSALPTGAATEATLSTLNGKVPSNLTVTSTRLLVDGSGVTQPISAVSLPLPTGAATESTLAAQSAKIPAQIVTAAPIVGSLPVVMGGYTASGLNAYAPSPISAELLDVDGFGNNEYALRCFETNPAVAPTSTITTETFAPAASPPDMIITSAGGSSTFIEVTGTWTGTITPQAIVNGTFQNVVIRRLGLSTTSATITSNGAYVIEGTPANLALINGVATGSADLFAYSAARTESGLYSYQAGTWAVTGLPAALGQTTMAASTSVAIASNQSAVPISAASLPLPSGAATETTLAAASAKLPATLGQKVMASSLAVAIASDQGSLAIVPSGFSKANAPIVTDYTGTPVTSAAWVQLTASLSAAVKMIEVFDSSGVAIYIGVGAGASEVIQCTIFPGGQGQIPLAIASGARVSLKAVSTSATTGTGIINFYG